MLTTTHITVMLTIGVLFSAGLWLATDGLVARLAWLEARKSWAKKWIPIYAGIALGMPLFPAGYSLVVDPVDITVWWKVVLWVVFGAFAGLVGGIGSWFAHDFAKAILEKVRK